MSVGSSAVLQRIIVRDPFINDTNEGLNHTFQQMSNSVLLFFRVLRSFSLFFLPRQKLNVNIAPSEVRLKRLTQYKGAQWWTQILVGQG